MGTTNNEAADYHSLRFMGEGEPETFRGRVYYAPEPAPITRDEAIAHAVAKASGPDGWVGGPPNRDEWWTLVDELVARGVLVWRAHDPKFCDRLHTAQVSQ